MRVVLPFLMKHLPVRRVRMGLGTILADEQAREHMLGGRSGHIVRGLAPNGPAERAGLKRRDIIIEVDGYALRPYSPMHDVLLPYRPGQSVTLGILRGEEVLQLTVELKLLVESD